MLSYTISVSVEICSADTSKNSKMEICDLEMGLKYLSGQGYTLSISEIAMLNASTGIFHVDPDSGYDSRDGMHDNWDIR